MESSSQAQRGLCPGDLVEIIPSFVPGLRVQPKGREGLVVRRVERPSQSWLAEQVDERWREFSLSQWWAFMPLDGGMQLVPEPLLAYRGVASRDQIMSLVDHATPAGRRTIAALFPDLVAELLRSS
jgi:hypothetical protein